MVSAFDLETELGAVVDAFAQHQVPYALCDGLALAVHGLPRATKDIDFLVDAGDVERAFESLKRAGFTLRAGPLPLGVGTANPVRVFRATKVVATSHLTVDLLEVSPANAEAWSGKMTVEWQGRRLSVVSRAGLILMKSRSTRLKDRADVELLQEETGSDE